MKIDTLDDPRTMDLMGRLRLTLYAVAGILERAKHFCARFAIDGDLTKLTPTAFERYIGWDGKAGALVEAMTSAGWIIKRRRKLLLADWYELAENATHMKLARAGARFADGRKPKTYLLPQDEREAADANFEAGTRRVHGGHRKNVPIPMPSPIPEPEPKPNPLPTPEPIPSPGEAADGSGSGGVLASLSGSDGLAGSGVAATDADASIESLKKQHREKLDAGRLEAERHIGVMRALRSIGITGASATEIARMPYANEAAIDHEWLDIKQAENVDNPAGVLINRFRKAEFSGDNIHLDEKLVDAAAAKLMGLYNVPAPKTGSKLGRFKPVEDVGEARRL